MISLKLFSKRVPDMKVLLLREMHRSYYDALGLTPKATNADIKKAYYKMSMVHHPDKEAGNSEKFREITTAYEVLGNIKLRKLYDQGLLSPAAIQNAAAKDAAMKDETKKSSNAKSKPQRTQGFHDQAQWQESENKRNQTYTGRSEHFDYDAWTQAHYKETFERRFTQRQERERRQEKVDEESMRRKEIMVWLGLASILIGITIGMKQIDFDSPKFVTTSNAREK